MKDKLATGGNEHHSLSSVISEIQGLLQHSNDKVEAATTAISNSVAYRHEKKKPAVSKTKKKIKGNFFSLI